MINKSNWLLKYSITILSCVLIITLGITTVIRAVPVTTTIGENISTNDLTVAGNATVTGNISATGTVESTSGGIKFPDATVQTTAGVTKVSTLSPEYMYPEDLGKNWKNLGHISPTQATSSVYLGSGIALLATEGEELYRSIDYGATWSGLGHVINPYALIYLGNGIVIAGDSSNNIYRSTDYGLTWVSIGVGGSISWVWSLEYLGNGIVLVGGTDNGVTAAMSRSTDYGVTWSSVPDDFSSVSWYFDAIEYLENGVVVAGTGTYIYRSTDFGLTWTIDPVGESSKRIRSSAYLGNGVVLMGANNGYISRSTDYGLTWTDLGSFSVTDVNDLEYLGNGIVLFGNCDSEIFKSMDYGLTWTLIGSYSICNVEFITYLGNGIIIAGGCSGEIIRSDISFKLNESLNLPNSHIPVDVTASRAFDTVYQNTGVQAKMISVSILATTTVADTNSNIQGLIGAADPPLLSMGYAGINNAGPARKESHQLTFIVPAGYYYKISQTVDITALMALNSWIETPL